ncbi:hypothetical protein [Actinomadura darangshiensis]|uniref:hypothetical protein n=1 Tax=Actinomadura darangshiensis TaxID=705336 RepID=UPI001A9FE19D|nr:hypothetical protein [Actinomadura darangshiensis]
MFGTEDAWREAPRLNGWPLPNDLAGTVQDAWASFVRSGRPGGGWGRHAPGAPAWVLGGGR